MAAERRGSMTGSGEPGTLRVVVNGRFLAQPVTGVQRFAREIVAALDGLHASEPSAVRGLEFELVTPHHVAADFGLSHIRTRSIGPLSGNLWEQLVLPRYAARGLLLNLANAAPLLSSRQAVTLHDAALWRVPEAYSARFRAWYKTVLPRVAARAEVVFTMSQSAASDLQRFVLRSGRSATVTSGGSEHVLRVAPDRGILDRAGLASQRFLLCVANRHPAKNVALVARALECGSVPDVTLVIVGAGDAKIYGREEHLSGRGRIMQLPRVSDAELRGLMEAAEVAICPSRYEGFGLPPLEAMACGCPVIASRIPAHQEVLGDAALFFEDGNRDALVTQLGRVLGDAGLRAELRDRGRIRAGQFRWKDAAKRILTSLHRVRERVW